MAVLLVVAGLVGGLAPVVSAAPGDPPVVIDFGPADDNIHYQPGDVDGILAQFDKNIELSGTGSITITGSLGLPVASYNLPHEDVQVFGDVLVVDPGPQAFLQGQMFSVQISSDAIIAEGEPGVYYAGINDTTTWNFAVIGNEGAFNTDGIRDALEAGAPNGGDGNGDGRHDSTQPHVASFPNSEVGGGAYMTIAIDDIDCSVVTDISIRNKASLGTDNNHDYPVGLLDFDVVCSGPGDSTEVTIYYDKVYDTSKWAGRKFVNGSFQNLPGAVFATANIGGNQVTTMTYTLVDGGPLDADGVANGRIQDPAGPGQILFANNIVPGAPNTGIGTASSLVGVSILPIAISSFIAVTIAIVRTIYRSQR